jgi:8-oxo-dGTP pyrophosphatase MutT (NUDIX family)
MAAKILNVSDAGVIRAAGGLIYRNGRRGPMELALAHRPAYDDWTFPKGKLNPEETPEEAALRETEEETGLRCKLVGEVGCTSYLDRRGRNKVVCYWLMEPIGGRKFEPGPEVDELRWVSVAEAMQLLTYDRDRQLLRLLPNA